MLKEGGNNPMVTETNSLDLEKQQRLAELKDKDASYELTIDEQKEFCSLISEEMIKKNSAEIGEVKLEIDELNRQFDKAYEGLRNKLAKLSNGPVSKTERRRIVLDSDNNSEKSDEFFEELQTADDLTDEEIGDVREFYELYRGKDFLIFLKKIEKMLDWDIKINTSKNILCYTNWFLGRPINWQEINKIADPDVKQEIKDCAEVVLPKIKEKISELIDKIAEGTSDEKGLAKEVRSFRFGKNIRIEDAMLTELDAILEKFRKW